MRTTTSVHGNGHGGKNGKSKGGGVLAAAGAVVRVVAAAMVNGFSFLTLPMDVLTRLLGPITDAAETFGALDDVPAAMDPGAKGNVSLAEGRALGAVLDAAAQYPEAFGKKLKDKTLQPWDTTALRANLARFMQLRAATSSPFLDKANLAARVLGAELRAQILPKYKKARVAADSDDGLADALKVALTHYGRGAVVKQAAALVANKQAAREAKAAAKTQRETKRNAQSIAKAQAEQQKQAATQQLKALRNKKKKVAASVG